MPIVSDKAVREIEEQIREELDEARGQGTGPEGTGGTSKCVCPSCGYEATHQRGTACNQLACPKCGAAMTGGPDAVGSKVRSEARGRGTGPEGTGGTDRCVCPSCGHEVPHARGTPCNQTKCPECGATMTGGPEAVGSKVR